MAGCYFLERNLWLSVSHLTLSAAVIAHKYQCLPISLTKILTTNYGPLCSVQSVSHTLPKTTVLQLPFRYNGCLFKKKHKENSFPHKINKSKCTQWISWTFHFSCNVVKVGIHIKYKGPGEIHYWGSTLLLLSVNSVTRYFYFPKNLPLLRSSFPLTPNFICIYCIFQQTLLQVTYYWL